MTRSTPAEVRAAIVEALPAEGSLHGGVPEQRHVYVPPAHAKALRLDAGLVIGARGVGKSFWSAALRSPEIRAFLGRSVADLTSVDVRTGHAETPSLDAYPSPDVFSHLVRSPGAADHVWRAVIARWLARVTHSQTPPCDTWEATVAWIVSAPEAFARLLESADATFSRQGRRGLIVFDALDRASRDWRTMDQIVRALLQVALLLKPFPHLHAKVFLREDQYARRKVADFPDASKLLSTRVELTWLTHDLHGLLWQYLVNARDDHGELLRHVYAMVVGEEPRTATPGVWLLHENVQRDQKVQRTLFKELAGEWMGTGPRRGMTYTWSVSHLADARGRSTPRSFLAALRAAAEDSMERHPEHGHPLHFESIERGVQEASKVRVAELAEDYAWVPPLMAPLAGMSVPSESESILARWRERYGEATDSLETGHLPPEHAELGWTGVLEDLERLGVIERMRDGRVNMPDLFRVGFGLGRKGGVKPLPSSATT